MGSPRLCVPLILSALQSGGSTSEMRMQMEEAGLIQERILPKNLAPQPIGQGSLFDLLQAPTHSPLDQVRYQSVVPMCPPASSLHGAC